VAALACTAVAALAPRAADAAWTPINYTLCGSKFTADPLQYVTDPVLYVYQLQNTSYVPLRSGVEYVATYGFMATDPKTNVTTLPLLFRNPGDYLAVMQFTPFVADVEWALVRTSGNYWRPNTYHKAVFTPPSPMITGVVFQIYKQNGTTPAAAGTEVLFGGYAIDVDPYAALTDNSGKVVTYGLDGTAYPDAACVSNLRRRTLPTWYPAITNSFFVQIPDVGGQGSFCDNVDIGESHTTINIVLKSNGCSVSMKLQRRRP